jgi:hypothetical protein
MNKAPHKGAFFFARADACGKFISGGMFYYYLKPNKNQFQLNNIHKSEK